MYFTLVLRSVRDVVPKQVGYFLVQRTQDELAQKLWYRINQNQRVSQQLGEPPQVTERRRMLQRTIDTLKNSLRVI
jgi:dynamin 1-like protein